MAHPVARRALVTHLRHHFVALSGFGLGPGLVEVVGEGLLHVCVLAQLYGRQRYLGVVTVEHSHRDGIEVFGFLIQQLPPVFMVFDLVFEKLVDVLDSADAELLFCNHREIQVAHLIAE